MSIESIKNEVSMALRLVAFKPGSVELAPFTLLGAGCALAEEHWDPVSDIMQNGTEYSRYFYGSAQKAYMRVLCNGTDNVCRMEAAEEGEVLEQLSFPEMKHLGNLIDKKSVAFIRMYAEKERASVTSEEELKALNERNERMIQEAEIALRKR